MTRVALIANPDSGQGSAERVEELLRAIGSEVEVFPVDEAERAAESGAERLVVAGGDGSIGSAAAAASARRIPLAVVATGTANDFATHHGLPAEIEAACGLAVSGQELRHLELARVRSRPFVNVAGAGLAPAAAEGAAGLKEKLGALAYPVGAVGAGLRAQPIHCIVSADGDAIFSGDAWQVSIASSGAFGGGSTFVADSSDGLLDLIVIEHTSRARLVNYAYGLRIGVVEDQTGVISRRAAEIQLELEPHETLNVDGELINTRDLTDDGVLDFSVERPGFDLVVG